MARFIAIAVGYDNLAVRQPGDEFELPDGSSGSWFKPAVEDTKGPAKGKKTKSDSEDHAGDTIA